MTVGRNDPCPCGSGKKFKKCHLQTPAVAPGIATRAIIPATWTEFPEATIVGVFDGCPRFARFWAAERDGIGAIRWFRDEGLPKGINYRATQAGDLRAIRLRNAPPLLEEEFSIVHELAHFLVDADGFPKLGSLTDHPAVSAINSLVHDPLVHRHLRKYGYEEDVRSEYENEVEEAKQQLTAARSAPNDALGRAHWAANYAGKVLDRVEAFGTREGDDFAHWFGERFATAAADGERVYAIIEQIGFDDPTKCREAFRRIVSKFGIEKQAILTD